MALAVQFGGKSVELDTLVLARTVQYERGLFNASADRSLGVRARLAVLRTTLIRRNKHRSKIYSLLRQYGILKRALEFASNLQATTGPQAPDINKGRRGFGRTLAFRQCGPAI